MTPIAFLAAGFAIAAISSLLVLIALTASESVTWGRITGSVGSWWTVRKRVREQKRERRVVLPKAYLVAPESGDVVSLRDVAVRRRVK